MSRTALALVALVLLAAPAAAQNEGKWGAIAYGAPDRATGTAVDFPSAGEARQAALDNCAGCSRTIVFLRTCAAVAESPAGAAAGASNRWRGRAESRALIACARTGSGCSVVAFACTTH